MEKIMLILTRRIGEAIIIGDDITMTVLGVKGNQVRLGTDAPKNVPVNRQEIWQRIKAEQDAKPQTEPPTDKPEDEEEEEKD